MKINSYSMLILLVVRSILSLNTLSALKTHLNKSLEKEKCAYGQDINLTNLTKNGEYKLIDVDERIVYSPVIDHKDHNTYEIEFPKCTKNCTNLIIEGGHIIKIQDKVVYLLSIDNNKYHLKCYDKNDKIYNMCKEQSTTSGKYKILTSKGDSITFRKYEGKDLLEKENPYN